MNTSFLRSPAYLLSITLLLMGAIFSGTRYMLIGWILFIVGLALNAMALVVLANRDRLHAIDEAAHNDVLRAPKKNAPKR
ncbi:MAG: hypothetical protein Q4P78_00255 [Rothia sp. (in: high G+C Gram-positive bacteria)]|uniref:hypothetical protein n=1 Tax=Rothia sp. (in: high G+C Gram-positive bacteria) TaxID=1885016 RepID=UPI0026E05F18|nr:hypothetical protein [Rothia sp. (in: high G+C Gram-positive bacteria)]MDO5749620.1 hypothetical protein [Rothia sp. (in: high G+C Gram-positive bacteria)]